MYIFQFPFSIDNFNRICESFDIFISEADIEIQLFVLTNHIFPV